MSAPTAMIVTCDNCGEVVHRVLKGKISGKQETVFEGVVKCQRCGRVHTVVLREPKPLKIKIILSWLEKSVRKQIEVERRAAIAVGELMEFEGSKIEITAIESGGRRVPNAAAEDINTLWAKKMDKVRIKVTTTRGDRSWSREILVEPEKEFSVGDELQIGVERTTIEKIKVHQRTMYRGSALAIDVKRIYSMAAHRPRRSFRFAPEKVGPRRHADKSRGKPRHRQ